MCGLHVRCAALPELCGFSYNALPICTRKIIVVFLHGLLVGHEMFSIISIDCCATGGCVFIYYIWHMWVRIEKDMFAAKNN